MPKDYITINAEDLNANDIDRYFGVITDACKSIEVTSIAVGIRDLDFHIRNKRNKSDDVNCGRWRLIGMSAVNPDTLLVVYERNRILPKSGMITIEKRSK